MVGAFVQAGRRQSLHIDAKAVHPLFEVHALRHMFHPQLSQTPWLDLALDGPAEPLTRKTGETLQSLAHY